MFEETRRAGQQYRKEAGKFLTKEHISSVKQDLERSAKEARKSGKRIYVFPLAKLGR